MMHDNGCGVLVPRADRLRYHHYAAIVPRLVATRFAASTLTYFPAVSVAGFPEGGPHA